MTLFPMIPHDKSADTVYLWKKAGLHLKEIFELSNSSYTIRRHRTRLSRFYRSYISLADSSFLCLGKMQFP